MKFKEFEFFHLWKTEPKRGISSSYLCRLRKLTIDMERGQKSEWNRHQFRQKRPKIERDEFRDFWCSWETKKWRRWSGFVNGEGEFDPWFLCSASGSIWVKTGSISVQKYSPLWTTQGSIDPVVGSIDPIPAGFFSIRRQLRIDRSQEEIDRSHSGGFFLDSDVRFRSIDPACGFIDPLLAGFCTKNILTTPLNTKTYRLNSWADKSKLHSGAKETKIKGK